MTKTDAIMVLVECGATKEKREDASGKTRSGWWLDGVWLAPAGDPVAAVRAMRG